MGLDETTPTAPVWPDQNDPGGDLIEWARRRCRPEWPVSFGKDIVLRLCDRADEWEICARQWQEHAERSEARAGDAEQRLAEAKAILEESAAVRQQATGCGHVTDSDRVRQAAAWLRHIQTGRTTAEVGVDAALNLLTQAAS